MRGEFAQQDHLPVTDRVGHACRHRVHPGALRADWDALVDAALQEATLVRPAPAKGYVTEGKQGIHSEHLGFVLAEMQSLARAHPGATW